MRTIDCCTQPDTRRYDPTHPIVSDKTLKTMWEKIAKCLYIYIFIINNIYIIYRVQRCNDKIRETSSCGKKINFLGFLIFNKYFYFPIGSLFPRRPCRSGKNVSNWFDSVLLVF